MEVSARRTFAWVFVREEGEGGCSAGGACRTGIWRVSPCIRDYGGLTWLPLVWLKYEGSQPKRVYVFFP